MAKLRSVSTYFWSDPFIEELSALEKLLFLYLITNDKTNMLGIYESTERKISFETGIEINDVKAILQKFEAANKIKRIGNYFVLINFMKNQNYNTNMKKSAIDFYNKLPNDLKINDLQIDKSNVLEGFERVRKGLGMVSNHSGTVRKEEVESKVEVEVESKVESKVEVEVEKNDSPSPPNYSDDFKVKNNPKKIEAENCETEKQKIVSDKKLIDVACMQNAITEQKFADLFQEFIKKSIAVNQTWESEKDMRTHLLNWIPKKLNSKNNGQLRPTSKPVSTGEFGEL